MMVIQQISWAFIVWFLTHQGRMQVGKGCKMDQVGIPRLGHGSLE